MTNDGGPAFPGERTEEVELFDGQYETFTANHGGMSLRDYFAAKAMQGQLSAQNEEDGFYVDFDSLSNECYRIADAMLKARAND